MYNQFMVVHDMIAMEIDTLTLHLKKKKKKKITLNGFK